MKNLCDFIQHLYQCLYAYFVYCLGLIIKDDELIDMTELAYGDKWRGVYPSAGGSGMLAIEYIC